MSYGSLLSSKPKLLIVLPASTFGGAERVVFNIVESAQQFQPVLLTQHVLLERFRGLNVSTLTFESYGCNEPYDLSWSNGLRYGWAISRAQKEVAAKVVLAVMHNGTFFAALGSLMGRFRSCLVGSIHGNISAFFAGLGAHPHPWQRLVIKVCVSVPRLVIAPSQGVKDDLVENFAAHPKAIQVIYNGIDLDQVRDQAASDQLMLNKDCPWIVSISRLGIQKDHSTLLKAFREVRNQRLARLILVGDGECRAAVEAEIHSLGLDADVVLMGFQPNPFTYLAKADVAVLSSFCEGFGVAIVEAFALGLAQVVTACPSGPDELIKNGVQGFLVPVGDWHQMAERVLQLLEDASLRKQMGEAGRARANDFKMSEMVRRYEETFTDLMAN